MSNMELPYKPGTKGFLITQRLLAGDDYDKIERELKVARKTIYNVSSKLKSKGFHVPASSVQFLPASSLASPNSLENLPTKLQEETPSRDTLKSAPVKEHPGEVRERSRATVEEGERAFERELWVKAQPIMRKVALNPKILLLYDYARTELGFDGDIGDFVSDCVDDFFNSRDIKVKIVREREVA